MPVACTRTNKNHKTSHIIKWQMNLLNESWWFSSSATCWKIPELFSPYQYVYKVIVLKNLYHFFSTKTKDRMEQQKQNKLIIGTWIIHHYIWKFTDIHLVQSPQFPLKFRQLMSRINFRPCIVACKVWSNISIAQNMTIRFRWKLFRIFLSSPCCGIWYLISMVSERTSRSGSRAPCGVALEKKYFIIRKEAG